MEVLVMFVKPHTFSPPIKECAREKEKGGYLWFDELKRTYSCIQGRFLIE